MSRIVSADFLSSVFAQETGTAFLTLLTLDHSTFDNPYRFVLNSENIVSRGSTFIAYPFDITFPNDDDQIPKATLVIDNVSRDITIAIRQISTPISVTIEVVLSTDYDVVEVAFENFELADVTYDAQTISGTIVLRGFETEPFPAGSFVPVLFPGLF